jgi:hypothetical protein
MTRLGAHVAGLAQADEVVSMVGLVGAGEETEGVDVVDRQAAPDVPPAVRAVAALLHDHPEADDLPVAPPIGLRPTDQIGRVRPGAVVPSIGPATGDRAELARAARLPKLPARSCEGPVTGEAGAGLAPTFPGGGRRATDPLGREAGGRLQPGSEAIARLERASGWTRANDRRLLAATPQAAEFRRGDTVRLHTIGRAALLTGDHDLRWHGMSVPPFLGSGTTAVAALATGRRFTGFDLDPEAINSTQRRLAAVSILKVP